MVEHRKISSVEQVGKVLSFNGFMNHKAANTIFGRKQNNKKWENKKNT